MIAKSLTLTGIIAFAAFTSPTMETTEKEVNVEKSQVVWKGYKVTGSHEGTVDLSSGKLIFVGEKLVGGTFTIDMSTLGSTDLSGDMKGKLDGHLRSNDFFGVEQHPNATLVFTNVKSTGKNSYEVTGDLTIKGHTNPVTFDFSIYGQKANAAVKIDRSKYDVRYGSTSFFDGLKDKAIYDEFDIIVDLEF